MRPPTRISWPAVIAQKLRPGCTCNHFIEWQYCWLLPHPCVSHAGFRSALANDRRVIYTQNVTAQIVENNRHASNPSCCAAPTLFYASCRPRGGCYRRPIIALESLNTRKLHAVHSHVPCDVKAKCDCLEVTLQLVTSSGIVQYEMTHTSFKLRRFCSNMVSQLHHAQLSTSRKLRHISS